MGQYNVQIRPRRVNNSPPQPAPPPPEDEGKLPQGKLPRAVTMMQGKPDGTVDALTVPMSDPSQAAHPSEFQAPSARAATANVKPSASTEFQAQSARQYNVRPQPQPITTSAPASAPTASAPAQAPNTRAGYLKRLDEANAALDEARKPGKPPHRFKAFLKMFGQQLGQQFQRPVRTWGELEAGLAGAGAAGVAGAIKPRIVEEQERFYNIKRAEGDQESALKAANAESEIERRGALTDVAREREARVTANQKRIAESRDVQNILREYHLAGKYDPADPNYGDLKRRAAALGLELAPYDASKGKLGRGFTFARIRYQLNEDGKPEPMRDEQGNVMVDTLPQERFDYQKQQDAKRFNADQHWKELNYNLSLRRTSAYEQAVRINGTREQIQQAQFAAEGDNADDIAEEIRSQQAELDADAALAPDDENKMYGSERRERERYVHKLKEEERKARVKANAVSGLPSPQSNGTSSVNPASMTSDEWRTYISGLRKKDGSMPTQAEVDASVEAHRQKFNK